MDRYVPIYAAKASTHEASAKSLRLYTGRRQCSIIFRFRHPRKDHD